MKYGMIKYYDISNGQGVRTSLYVSGCRRHCKECFNACTWSFDYGNEFSDEVKEEILKSLDSPYIEGLTVLGGEPFEVENQRELVSFLKTVKEKYPDKTIWAFSGNTFEEILFGKDGGELAPHLPENHAHCEVTEEMLSYIDVLVDGPFINELKDITLKFRGSRNQRILDMKRSLSERKPIHLNI